MIQTQEKHGQKLAKAGQRLCAKQSKNMCKRTPSTSHPLGGREAWRERGQVSPLTKAAGELEAADQLLADRGGTLSHISQCTLPHRSCTGLVHPWPGLQQIYGNEGDDSPLGEHLPAEQH